MKHRFVFAATAATLILSACGSNEARDAAPAPPATPAFASDRISVTPRGAGPEQGRLNREGNRYLNTYFPQLDSIVTARIK